MPRPAGHFCQTTGDKLTFAHWHRTPFRQEIPAPPPLTFHGTAELDPLIKSGFIDAGSF